MTWLAWLNEKRWRISSGSKDRIVRGARTLENSKAFSARHDGMMARTTPCPWMSSGTASSKPNPSRETSCSISSSVEDGEKCVSLYLTRFSSRKERTPVSDMEFSVCDSIWFADNSTHFSIWESPLWPSTLGERRNLRENNEL